MVEHVHTLENKLRTTPTRYEGYETLFPKEWPLYKHILAVTLLFTTIFSVGYLANSAINYFYPDKVDKMFEEINEEDVKMNKFNETQK